jgi:hypothetical protein
MDRAMCRALTGASPAGLRCALGSSARAAIATTENTAATVKTMPRLKSAMNPPIAGAITIPATFVDCM